MDVQLTSSRPRRAGKRSGTQAEKGVSAPPLLWLCTLTLSWEETDDPEPNRTLRLGLPHLRKARLYLSVWQRHCCCSWIWKQDLEKKRTWLGPPFETTAPAKWKKMNYYAAGSLWVRLDICVYMHIISHAYVESKAVWSYQRGRKIDTTAIAFHSAHECNCWNMPQVMKWPSHQNISFYIAMVTPHQARWKWQFNMHGIASNFPLFGRH